MDSLVAAGNKNYPELKIIQGSIFEREKIAPGSIDVITLLGVISIFDDVEPAIKNLAYWIRPGGKMLIHGMFNPVDVDVYVKYRMSEDYNVGPFQSGWNIISQKSISKLLIKSGAKQIKFHEFKISVDLFMNFQDPLRSWTQKREDGTRQITNGTCLNQPQFILECDF